LDLKYPETGKKPLSIIRRAIFLVTTCAILLKPIAYLKDLFNLVEGLPPERTIVSRPARREFLDPATANLTHKIFFLANANR
jgi:hypothetical protein